MTYEECRNRFASYLVSNGVISSNTLCSGRNSSYIGVNIDGENISTHFNSALPYCKGSLVAYTAIVSFLPLLDKSAYSCPETIFDAVLQSIGIHLAEGVVLQNVSFSNVGSWFAERLMVLPQQFSPGQILLRVQTFDTRHKGCLEEALNYIDYAVEQKDGEYNFVLLETDC